ncbi:unnamed protein product, partial [Lymnaea stagnalis]
KVVLTNIIHNIIFKDVCSLFMLTNICARPRSSCCVRHSFNISDQLFEQILIQFFLQLVLKKCVNCCFGYFLPKYMYCKLGFMSILNIPHYSSLFFFLWV